MKNNSAQKIALTVVVACFLVGVTALWWFSQRTPQSPAVATPIEKITIGNIGEYSIFNLIAKEKGYFQENGLDAEIREYDAGPSAIAALLDGSVDVAVAAEFVGVRNMFAHNNLRIITQASKHEVFHVIGRVERGIRQPSDLRNKKVGVTRKSAGEFYLGRFLTFNNLTLKDVTIIDLPPAEMISRLESGAIDAAVIFDPHAYDLEKKLGNAVVAWSAQGEQKTFALTYSTKAFISAHPDMIERYMRSLIKAEDYVKEKPEEARQLIAALLNYDPAYVDYIWRHFTFVHGLDQGLLFTMEDQARWVIANRLTDQTVVPNYLNAMYFDALAKVKPEAVTIIH